MAKQREKITPVLTPMFFNPPAKRKIFTAAELRDLPYSKMVEQVKKQEKEFNQDTRPSHRAADLINRLSGGEQVFWFKNARGYHYRDQTGERIDPDLIYQLLYRHILRFENEKQKKVNYAPYSKPSASPRRNRSDSRNWAGRSGCGRN